MERLRKVVEETNTRSGLVFDLSIQVLIVASIVIFALETLPDLNNRTVMILSILEAVCITVFTL
jgi:voltage-gated potassium channel